MGCGLGTSALQCFPHQISVLEYPRSRGMRRGRRGRSQVLHAVAKSVFAPRPFPFLHGDVLRSLSLSLSRAPRSLCCLLSLAVSPLRLRSCHSTRTSPPHCSYPQRPRDSRHEIVRRPDVCFDLYSVLYVYRSIYKQLRKNLFHASSSSSRRREFRATS